MGEQGPDLLKAVQQNTLIKRTPCRSVAPGQDHNPGGKVTTNKEIRSDGRLFVFSGHYQPCDVDADCRYSLSLNHCKLAVFLFFFVFLHHSGLIIKRYLVEILSHSILDAACLHLSRHRVQQCARPGLLRDGTILIFRMIERRMLPGVIGTTADSMGAVLPDHSRPSSLARLLSKGNPGKIPEPKLRICTALSAIRVCCRVDLGLTTLGHNHNPYLLLLPRSFLLVSSFHRRTVLTICNGIFCTVTMS